MPGEDSTDVYGNPAKPRRRPKNINLGDNVELNDDEQTVRSTAAGQVILEKARLSVRTVLEVAKNVDFETGNVDAASDVLVRGSVQDLFIVKSKRNISINGMTEASYLFAGGDVTIIGGVKGRDKGLIEADGDVHAKFLNYSYVTAGGDVEIGKEILDSIVLGRGQLNVSYGSVIGGYQFMMGGAKMKSLGSPSGVRTVIGVGCDPRSSRRILEIDEKIAKMTGVVEKIHLSVDPLMQHLKRLMPEQREKATELMFRATNLEQEIKELKDEKNRILAESADRDQVELSVSAKIFPNTEVYVFDKMATIRDEVIGPVKILLRKVRGVTEMLMINRLSASTRTLASRQSNLGTLELPEKPKIAQPGAEDSQQQDQLREVSQDAGD